MDLDLFPGTPTPTAGRPTTAAPSDSGPSNIAATILQQRLRAIAFGRFRVGTQPPRCNYWVQVEGEVRSTCAS